MELVEMKYANMHGYTDIEPFEIVKVISDKTIEVRAMSATLDNWKPEIIPGGFAGHCTNQNTQTYIYTSNEQAPVIRCRKRKDGYFHSPYGRHVLSDKPRKFHDYNF